MHPVTLAFGDPELERAYLAQRVTRWRTYAISTAVWAGAVGIGAIAMPAASRGYFRSVLLAALPVIALCMVIPRVLPARLRDRAMTIAAPSLVYLPMLGAFAVEAFGAPVDPSFNRIGVVLATFMLCLGVGLRFLPAVFLSLSLVVLYLASIIWFSATSHGPIVNTVFWLALALLVAMQQGYAYERSRRRIFLQQRTIDEERAKSERLLRNVLPEAIADRLKKEPARIADHFDQVTVLFGDIVGFTPLSSELSPAELVAALDEVFSAFDDIAHRHGLEKIKTIGDAYMVVGGVPTPRADHAESVALMALEMREVIARKRFAGGRQLRMRIGIHSGPVVAGVIGKKKFIYDLWGDTVNTASRMESHGVEGMVQVTAATAELLRGRFQLTARGAVQVKGKGEMETWFVDRSGAS
jgi:class 3 adenylate cyclase